MREGFPERRAHCIARLTVHLVWATHNREPWLGPDVDAWLSELLGNLCVPLGCTALAVGNASDHVHVLAAFAPTVAIASLSHRLKGANSRLLSSHLGRRIGWQAGYYAETVDDFDALAAYVRSQREHHRRTTRREPWEATFSRNGEPGQ
jgi:REP-associated tyrosine transposase